MVRKLEIDMTVRVIIAVEDNVDSETVLDDLHNVKVSCNVADVVESEVIGMKIV